MSRTVKFFESYRREESFDEKIDRLEKIPNVLFRDENKNRLTKSRFNSNRLYHGLRFNGIDKLESIIKTGYILCGRDVENEFESYNGTSKWISTYDSDENCNQGKYISVIPFIGMNAEQMDKMEFITFIKNNIYLELSEDIDAYSTHYLRYDDYIRLVESGRPVKNLYSYAFNEYMVKDRIPLDKICAVGIDTYYYQGSVRRDIDEIEKILDYYKVDIPLRITGSGRSM